MTKNNKPTVAVEEITPAWAEEILGKHNTKNFRKLDDFYLRTLARSVKKGDFDLNGESIVLDSDGNLIDGQHRLAAVAHAKKSIFAVVVRGVDPKASLTLDTGKRRSAAHHIQALGFTNPNNIACVANIWQNYLNGERGKQLLNGRWQIKETIAFITGRENRGHRIQELVKDLAHASKFCSLSLLIANAFLAMEHYPEEKVIEFVKSVAERNAAPASPAGMLTKRLIEEKLSTIEGHMARWSQMLLMGRAMKAHCEGQEMVKLQVGKAKYGGVYPEFDGKDSAAA